MAERGAHNLSDESKLKQTDEKLKQQITRPDIKQFVENHRLNNTQLESMVILQAFIDSRKIGMPEGTKADYVRKLKFALPELGLKPTIKQVQSYYKKLESGGYTKDHKPLSQGAIDNYHKCLSAFYNWYFSPKSELGTNPKDNPMPWIDRPGKPKLLLDWYTTEDIDEALKAVDKIPVSENYNYHLRDKALIAVLPESGLRVSECSELLKKDVDFEKYRIFVRHGKGNKQRYAPFGELTHKYLKAYIDSQPNLKNNDYIWRSRQDGTINPKTHKLITHLGFSGIEQALDKVGKLIDKHLNPHSFRRTFAIWQRLEGVDTLMIRDMGGWESVTMVERYTRSLDREQALNFYKSPYKKSNLSEYKPDTGNELSGNIVDLIQNELGGKLDTEDIEKLLNKLKAGVLPTMA